MSRVLWAIVAILLALWLVGLVTNVLGGLIHVILVVIVAAIIYRVITRGRG